MEYTRVIPCLLMLDQGLVKTRKFRKPVYVGDPINVMRIFNDKEVDELVLLDIGAPRANSGPQFEFLEQLATECFMPLAYGGGIQSMTDAERLFKVGFEKIVLNRAAVEQPALVESLVRAYGSQAVVASIDVGETLFGKPRVFAGGLKKTKLDPVAHAIRVSELGVGEILLTSISREGQLNGYDVGLIKSVAAAVPVPVIASGGASGVPDFRDAVERGGASAVSAGSCFVFNGPHKAVLISYPAPEEIKSLTVYRS